MRQVQEVTRKIRINLEKFCDFYYENLREYM